MTSSSKISTPVSAAPTLPCSITIPRRDESIPDRLACLIEPFTVGCRAARRSNPKPGETAVVFGCGTIGMAAAVALKYFCDYSDFRLNIAEELDFAVCRMGSEDFITKAIEIFGTASSHKGKTADLDHALNVTIRFDAVER